MKYEYWQQGKEKQVKEAQNVAYLAEALEQECGLHFQTIEGKGKNWQFSTGWPKNIVFNVLAIE